MARRITSVIAFWLVDFFFGRGPTNGTLSFYECRLSGGDTQTLCAVIKFILTISDGGGY